MKKAESVFLPIILCLSLFVHASEYFEISSALSELEQLMLRPLSDLEHKSSSLSGHHTHAQNHQNTLKDGEAGLPLGDVKNIKNWSITHIAELFSRTMYRAHEEFILKHIDQLFLDYANKLDVKGDVDIVSFFIAYACIFNAVYMSTSMTSWPLMDSDFSHAINTMNDLLNSIQKNSSMKILPTTNFNRGFDDEKEFSDSDSDDTGDEEDNNWPSSLSLFYELEKKRSDTALTILQRAQKFKTIKMGDLFDEYHVGKILIFSLVSDMWVMDNFLTPFYEKAHRAMNSSSMRIQAQSIVHMLQCSGWLKGENMKNPYLNSLKVLLKTLVDKGGSKDS